jgi:general secretion pathway protein G
MVRGGQDGKARRLGQGGFTLIELMTVIAMIFILVGIALPRFRTSIVHAREAALKEDLSRLRQSIDQYHADKGRYPPSLEALVEEGYIRRLEVDPMTGAADWEAVAAEAGADDTSGDPGIYDVHSASTDVSLSGEPYNEW